MRNVLVALKGSREVAQLTVAAATLVGPATEVDVVHGVGTGPVAGPRKRTSRAANMLRAGDRGAGLRTLDRDGGVAVALSDTARSLDADLIVLRTRRPGLWEALVVGSTSHGVLQRSERPVLIAGRRRGGEARGDGKRPAQGRSGRRQPCEPGVPVWRAR